MKLTKVFALGVNGDLELLTICGSQTYVFINVQQGGLKSLSLQRLFLKCLQEATAGPSPLWAAESQGQEQEVASRLGSWLRLSHGLGEEIQEGQAGPLPRLRRGCRQGQASQDLSRMAVVAKAEAMPGGRVASSLWLYRLPTSHMWLFTSKLTNMK